MAQNKLQTWGPIALTNSVANIINPPTLTGGINNPSTTTATYFIVRKMTIVNKTASAVNASFWLGATGGSAAGTEVFCSGQPVPANTSLPFFGQLRLDSGQFLTGQAGANTSLTVTLEGEIGVA